MLQAKFWKHTLQFKRPSGTSRGVLNTKDSWLVEIWNTKNPKIKGIGECSIIKGLSIDSNPNYEEKVKEVCENIHIYVDNFNKSLVEYPSIRFGIEMALLDLKNGGNQLYFNNDFTQGKIGIPINGLVWMGTESFMQEQIEEKLEAGFDCIKMKIGAINFDAEFEILKQLRKRYSAETLEIRVDANGAFSASEALGKLERLSTLNLHSIEQPIKQGQIDEMAKLCAMTPLPIALDEELIGINNIKEKASLLNTIKPHYIILKPSLVGGFKSSDEWIHLGGKDNIGWWATSALESNIGLKAIAQYTASKNTTMYQGLGTGSLYTNNIESTMNIRKGKLFSN